MDDNQKKIVQQMIEQALKEAKAFSTEKYGDTPTDDLQLTPKKYVSSVISDATSSVFSSVLAGFAITGNLRVGGDASVVGTLDAGTIQTGNITATGNASIAGSLKVGGTASVGGQLSASGGLRLFDALMPRIYTGLVSSNGNSSSPFPNNWTSSLIASPGGYKVTHNLGDVGYTIGLTPLTFVAIVNARNTNDFTVNTLDAAGSLQNDSFYFIVGRP